MSAEKTSLAEAVIQAVTNPGVRIKKEAGIPTFRADPSDPSLVIRVLDGKTTRGKFKEGQFIEVSV